MTVSQYLREWLRAKQPELQRSTFEAYTVYLEKQIIPNFDRLGKPLE